MPYTRARMVPACLLMVLVGFAIALPMTAAAIRVGRRVGAVDSAGVAGQVKAPRRAVPNTGGVAIFLGVAGPMLAGLAAAHLVSPEWLARLWPEVAEQAAGVRERTSMAGVLLACVAALHAMGLVDDRKPLGPWVKLGVMLLAAGAAVTAGEGTRLLTLLDGHVGGAWLSIALTIAWIVVVTNAMNFMDNMDGLAGGVGAVAGSCFLASALLGGQWFVAGVLALLVGSLAGFLVFNAPRPGGRGARVFMGDGGSLVVGFLLAFLAVRTTYVPTEAWTFYSPLGATHERLPAGGWHAVFVPLAVLAIPLYDFVSVVAIRLGQGRSPMVGDLQHFSHRLVMGGLSKRSAVAVIWGFTAVTGISGVILPWLRPWQAVLAGVQILLLLGVLATFEWASARGRARTGGGE